MLERHPMTDRPDRISTHLYAPPGQFPVPASINEPKIDQAAVEQAPQKSAVGRAKPARLLVLCDLPQRLPVLPQEVALIQFYLPDLLQLLAANDNEHQS
jgi:hypothetical protein